jgi:hypothetical protein
VLGTESYTDLSALSDAFVRQVVGRVNIAVAVALRHALIEVAGSRNAQLGQQTKMELVYQYLTGPRFRQRLESIIEKFDELKEDLDTERKFMNRVWAKRENQIQSVIDSTTGMWGDLQSIAGKALPEIATLEAAIIKLLRVRLPDEIFVATSPFGSGRDAIPELMKQSDTRFDWVIRKRRDARLGNGDAAGALTHAWGRLCRRSSSAIPLPLDRQEKFCEVTRFRYEPAPARRARIPGPHW